MTKQAILTKPFQVGCGSRFTLKAGTVVNIEQRGEKYVLIRNNFQGLISQDSFRWSEQQQLSLFGANR